MIYIFDKIIVLSMVIFPISILGVGVAWLGSDFRGRIIRSPEDIEALNNLFKSRLGKTSFFTMVLSGIILFSGTASYSKIMENKIKNDLRGFNSQTDKLLINNKQVTFPNRVIDDIVDSYHISSSQSYPTKSLKVKAILNSKEINLTLSRDNLDSTIYWIFVPDYFLTRHNALWKAKTNLFNTYK